MGLHLNVGRVSGAHLIRVVEHGMILSLTAFNNKTLSLELLELHLEIEHGKQRHLFYSQRFQYGASWCYWLLYTHFGEKSYHPLNLCSTRNTLLKGPV